ncbi:hypothetical protein M758_3G223800 [Ceratodon purpureus]|uniref:Large ribosomal subunit protein eL40 domain-containing protein n=1 Tax=Ceratodon purpureus TaxID=3225 RepID=A0A8T0IN08_CERPU|nr:hypothetical protein KC19_3G222400 [Ceratodon purpureus]KAG0624095.1 hypothetical protein M758_3G223800 [Ceratodon purpureus]
MLKIFTEPFILIKSWMICRRIYQHLHMTSAPCKSHRCGQTSGGAEKGRLKSSTLKPGAEDQEP